MRFSSSRPALSVALLSLGFFSGAAVAAEDSDVRELVATGRQALADDLADWAERVFRRRVRRERLDKSGKVVWRQAYLFEVRPTGEGFDEELLEIDGQEPTSGDVEHHRRAGRFGKHYDAAVEARLRNPFGADLPLQPLLFNQEHRYAGRETVDGITCDRIVFDARSELEDRTVSEQLERAARGTLCLSAVGAHIVEAEVETVRPVGKAPLRLDRLTLRFQSRPVGESWLPRLFETSSEFKLMLRTRRTRNRYEYSEYRSP
jgi:hypothetical protein